MIICPNCHHKEFPGALFCSECGARLISLDYLTTKSIQKIPTTDLDDSILDQSESENVVTDQESQNVSLDAEIALYVVDAKQTMQLAGRTEFTMGRVAEGQPILPDVDLSPFEAYSQGVSRLH